MNMLLQFLEENKSMTCAQNLQNKETFKERKSKWDDLTDMLNAEVGATKSTTQWQKCWSDIKCKTKQLAGEEKKIVCKTGGGPSTSSSLTDHQRRVIGILGMDSVEGCGGPRLPLNPPLVADHDVQVCK